jgi:DNA modification methylase
MVQSLMHKNIVEDATLCMTAVPDYVLLFRKGGENKVKVTHEKGFTHYFGKTPMLPEMEVKYGKFEHLKVKYENWDDPKTNKLSHIIWQRYASSVWDDIDGKNVLPFRDSKEEDDEKHVHPLQLDVIDRLVELYSNPGEVVLTPFMGVGSEVFSPVSLGRKAIGIELKDSYYKQAILNLKESAHRFDHEKKQLTLI